MPLDRISAVVITRDAAATLPATLSSLADFADVVVFDNGSTDDTVALARRHANVRVVEGDFQGFGPTRNEAAAHAAHDWVFSIDADERPDEALLSALDAADLDDPDRVYAVLRENRLLGQAVTRGGWGNEWKRRLYHRRRVAWEAEPVHEHLERAPGQRVSRLDGRIIHDAVTDLGQFLTKVRDYSALRADAVRPIHPSLIVLRAAWAFLRSYVFQLGCLAGWRGLVIAWSNANGVFFKYLRARIRHREDQGNPGDTE